MSFILEHFQSFIRNHEQLYYLLLGFHDVLINMAISLPFAYGATKLIKTNLLKPLLFAAFIVFVFMHWHMIRNLIQFSGNDVVYRTIIILGYAVQLPLAYGCVSFFQQRASA
ncbi:hypothetical protein [Aestuariibacter sp. A3R04]|uniref:hypothetical protein n=1 Tax=Aestuariibacter sp. A3R04 TaxID=2841571 RepID=UPI001C08A7B9|nr:hypothetical protein [Aestuariibacter sp. A3R04]MBU3021589.1 hypothetical protein [Aestuariibacter sp. A3R04]